MKCQECGNDEKFYRFVSVQAKIRTGADGRDFGTAYDVEVKNQDNWFEPTYCCKCDKQISV